MPDGQGQISHFNMLGADRIEVMRGPFSALYGNSSGGVVQIVSADGIDGTDISRLLMRIAEAGFDAVKTENLYAFDGERGYSQAQGE